MLRDNAQVSILGRWLRATTVCAALCGCASDAKPDQSTTEKSSECNCDVPPELISAECFCSFGLGCRSFEHATAFSDECSPAFTPPTLTSGCGVLAVSLGVHYSETYVFDAETHELLAARFVSDTSFGPCDRDRREGYVMGEPTSTVRRP